MGFLSPETQETVRNNEVSVLSGCPGVKRGLTVDEIRSMKISTARIYFLTLSPPSASPS